jgi:hypothetical protein
MDVRARLLALLVAALCAVGWVPTGRAGGPGDRVTARDGVGVLFGRRQHVSTVEIDTDGDDDPPCEVPGRERAESIGAEPPAAMAHLYVAPRLARSHGLQRQRGPPSIA